MAHQGGQVVGAQELGQAQEAEPLERAEGAEEAAQPLSKNARKRALKEEYFLRKRMAQKEAKREAKQAKRDANQAKWEALSPEVQEEQKRQAAVKREEWKLEPDRH